MDHGIQANSSESNPSHGHVSHLALDIGGNSIQFSSPLDFSSKFLFLMGFFFPPFPLSGLALICLFFFRFFFFLTGSLIKLVYFSRTNDVSVDNNEEKSSKETVLVSNGDGKCPVLQGRLHFAKFETSKINDCLEFIQRNQLHLGGM